MKRCCFLLVLFSVIIVSCGNNEEKAYVNAEKSTSTFVLKNYLAKYGEDAPIEHIEVIQQRLNELINDSVDYEFVIGASADISQKYDAEIKYLNKHPNGLHFKEVDSMMKVDEPAYNEWLVAKKAQEEAEAKKALYEEKYGEYRDRMKNFWFVHTKRSGFAYVFDVPDENGKGVGARLEWGIEWVPLTYEIQNNGDIYINKNGKRGIANIYSTTLYTNFGGEINEYNRALIIDDYPELIKMIRK